MSNLVSFLILVLGVFLSLFLFWKFTRDDYEDSDIFALWFIALTGGFVGFFIVDLFWRADSLLIGLAVAVLLGTLRARRLKMKLFEILEASVPSVFLFLLFVLLSWAVTGITIGLIADVIIIVLMLVLFFFLKANYRRFLWYPSGRVGFASLATVAIYFIIRGLVASFTPMVLSLILVLFSPIATLTFCLFVGALCLVLLYIRSERNDLIRFSRSKQ